jgi:hypothetical protein
MLHRSLVEETDTSLEKRFQKLAEEWRDKTLHLSFIEDRAVHPAYQRIIGMGPRVLPLILRELQAKPDHWFWALHAITGEDPAAPDAIFAEATRAWLAWGREQGYLPPNEPLQA